MDNIEIKFARIKQKDDIKNLLINSQLPVEDIDNHLNNFILAMDSNNILGTIGIEIYNEYGVIRSCAVSEINRNDGIGKVILTEMINYSRKKNIKTLFLLTTTAENYFFKYGFNNISRDSAPIIIKDTKEFTSICPVSSSFMKLDL